VQGKFEDPKDWAAAARRLGYSAVALNLSMSSGEDAIRAYARAAEEAGLLIAEVGAWSNPISPNPEERKTAMEKCQDKLAVADLAGAKCCVNVSGSRGPRWAGPHEKNLTPETFEMIVECVRTIVDAVKPTRSYYTLEMMAWMYPDDVDSYLRLIKAIDRDRFAVHIDMVNIVCSPQRYYTNTALIREAFEALGPYVKSCHGKDINLQDQLTTHLDEIRPGLGYLDYDTYLREIEALGPDTPLMLEHLKSEEEYKLAADYVREMARKAGVAIR